MDHAESTAKIVVEATILGSKMRFRSDQSQSVHDFDLEYPDGRVVAAEVTACVDQKGEEIGAAIRNPRRGGRTIPRVLCANDWRIHPAPDARINLIRAKVDEYLAAVEAEGVDRFLLTDGMRFPSVKRIQDDLRVTAGHVTKWKTSGSHHLAHPITGGAIGALLVIEAVMVEAVKPDNVMKLGNAGTAERHLMVYMHHGHHLTRMAFLEFEPPSVLPGLPPEITHVWVFSEKLQGDGFVIWRASTASPWERLPDPSGDGVSIPFVKTEIGDLPTIEDEMRDSGIDPADYVELTCPTDGCHKPQIARQTRDGDGMRFDECPCGFQMPEPFAGRLFFFSMGHGAPFWACVHRDDIPKELSPVPRGLVALKVFADESADATGTRVFAVGGIAGTEDDWVEAERRWLTRTDGKRFHANRCESEYANDPDPQKHKDNLSLYRDLTSILAESHLAGVAVALDLGARAELFPDVPDDIGYQKSFSDLITACGTMAHRLNGQLINEGAAAVQLEFTFASRTRSDGTARIAYRMLINSPQWASTGVFHEDVKFESEWNPRLDMSDLLVRESSKELDRLITKSRPKPRGSLGALEQSGKFIFIQHDRAYCERWKNQMAELQEVHGIYPAKYAAWLHETGRVQGGRPADSLANRCLYLMWLDGQAGSVRQPSSSSRT